MFNQLQAMLDRVSLLAPYNWVTQLQSIRAAADQKLEVGDITEQQWQELVARSARIQDRLNEKPEPDANCITTPDGGCIGGTLAGKPPCMHDVRDNA